MSTLQLQSNEMSSDLQNFYRNKTVFVTGGTGFMGIVLIEKLLRATDVQRIYLLIRSKGEKSADERLTSLFESVLFDKLKKTCVTLNERVKPILGDCSLVNLGISQEDRKVLIKEVNVVIHLAATVRFKEPLCRAVEINVRATLDLLQLAKEMEHLEAFVHVSSAFANCVVHSIEEKYYTDKLGISAVNICEMAKTLGYETTNKLGDALSNQHINTYAFTKSLAEEAVLSEGRTLPISIFRPAIVIQTYKEPLSGWIGNLHGPSALLYASGRGVLRVLYMKSHHQAHLVPADYCANLMLAIGWETANKSQTERLKSPPAIYNYSSDDENPLIWKEYMTTISGQGSEVPLTKMVWYPFIISSGQKWLYNLLIFLYHTIPGHILDFLLVLKGKKKRMTKLYNKIHTQTKLMEYFINNEFKFTMENTKSLWNSLSARDKDIFNFNLRSINWTEYLTYSLWGMRLYLGRETPDTLPEAQKKYKRLFILNVVVHVLVVGLFVTLLWTLFKAVLF